jgi:hypothetical protein
MDRLGRANRGSHAGQSSPSAALPTKFRAWADEWLSTAVHLKPKTRAGYESILNQRVLPVFGRARMVDITQVDIRRFVAELVHAGDQPGTVRNTFDVVRLVFGVAVGSGAIRESPCRGLRLPRSAPG